VEGEVIVQSFTPFHSAIQYARRHDYNGFYEQEIEWRLELKYPPLSRILLLTFKGRNEEKIGFVAQFIKKEIEKNITNFPDLVISGPAPAPLLKAETYYRHHLMIRTRSMSKLSKRIAVLLADQKLPDGISMALDIDPVDLM
jgi:primosomal protein N' (replication factor Y)